MGTWEMEEVEEYQEKPAEVEMEFQEMVEMVEMGLMEKAADSSYHPNFSLWPC